jgi:pimeloyl-ACP methyl ester carboxylesterase
LPLAMQHFSSAGIDIAFIDESPVPDMVAKPPVLLIHGFASNVVVNWIDPGWVRTLTRAGHRVIALDNRGHGQSEKLYDEAAYGPKLMAGDARNLLDHLGIERAHVFGYSMGARVTAFLALAHPERVRSAVFGGLGANMVRGLAGARPIAKAMLEPRAEDVTNAAARTFRTFADTTGADRRALAACVVGSREALPEEEVRRIAVPVLVAVGDQDVIGGSAAELAAMIPGAEAFVIAGRDHMKAVGDMRFKEKVVAWLGGRG